MEAASSFQFSDTGQYVATRDYMHGAIWDVRKADKPLRNFEVHEHLWDRLMDVYENESIFDRLGCAVSPSGQHIALGSYCELNVFNLFSDTFTTLRSCGSPVAVNVRCCSPFATSALYQSLSLHALVWLACAQVMLWFLTMSSSAI